MELIRTKPDGEEEFVAEAFWWDETNRFTIEYMEPGLPFSVVEAFIAEARRLVQPMNVKTESNLYVPDPKA